MLFASLFLFYVSMPLLFIVFVYIIMTMMTAAMMMLLMIIILFAESDRSKLYLSHNFFR